MTLTHMLRCPGHLIRYTSPLVDLGRLSCHIPRWSRLVTHWLQMHERTITPSDLEFTIKSFTCM